MKVLSVFVLFLTFALVKVSVSAQSQDSLPQLLGQIVHSLLNGVLALFGLPTISSPSAPTSPLSPGVIGVPCQLQAFDTGLVCVCDSNNCDTLEFAYPSVDKDVLIFSTSETGLRFNQYLTAFGTPEIEIPIGPYPNPPSSTSPLDPVTGILSGLLEFLTTPSTVNININREKTYQEIVGFGASFTDAVTINLDALLDPELRNHVYRSCYSKEVGNGYNMERHPIGGADFSTEAYAYNEVPVDDLLLTGFTALHPLEVRRVNYFAEMVTATGNDDFKRICTAWSPPPWMKTNNAYEGPSSLKTEYFQTWANYHVKYLELMEAANFPCWAVTAGNEPTNPALSKFMSLGWDPISQGKWVKENLGPTIKASSTVADTKIIAGDDQRYIFPWWFILMFTFNPSASKAIDYLAVHWYFDDFIPALVLDIAHALYPNKPIISTEACEGSTIGHKPILGDWKRGESYIDDILENLNHNVAGWVDWNMILDENGGPNYVGNYVDAAIIRSNDGDKIYKQPMFYGIGHFSRFLVPGSIRLYSKSSHKFIQTTVFRRPDLRIVVVLYNKSEQSLSVKINDPAYGTLRVKVPGKSLHTVVYK